MGTSRRRSAGCGARFAGAVLGSLLLLPAVAGASAPVFQHTPPSGSAPGNIVIRARIRANGPVLEPFCFWRVAGEHAFARAPLHAQGGARYEAVIARRAIPARARAIEYYLEAFDSNLAEGSWHSKRAPYLLRLRPTAARHTFTINSVPAGALLDLDGATVGSTPFRTRLAPGSHVFSLRMPGYLEFRQEIRLPAGRDVTLTIPLAPEPVAVAPAGQQRSRNPSAPATAPSASAPVSSPAHPTRTAAAGPTATPAPPASSPPARPLAKSGAISGLPNVAADLLSFPDAGPEPAPAGPETMAPPPGTTAPAIVAPAPIVVPLPKAVSPAVPPAVGVVPTGETVPVASEPKLTARGPWWWIAGTVGLAAAAVGTYYALDSRSARAELEGLSTPSDDVPATALRMRSSAITADALYAGAAVAAVGSVVVFAWRVP